MAHAVRPFTLIVEKTAFAPPACCGTAVAPPTAPVPSCPAELSPQHHAWKSASMAHVFRWPGEMLRKECPPKTGIGVVLLAVSRPLPSCPVPSPPQQYAGPPATSAQLCCAPLETEVS